MAWRTTPDAVSKIIRDYDDSIDLEEFITPANVLTDKVAAADSDDELTSGQLEQIDARRR